MADRVMNENRRVAEMLREAGTLLAQQGANPFRVNAYRKAADTVDGLDRGIREIFASEGTAGLDALPGIGPRRAAAIAATLTAMLDKRRALRRQPQGRPATVDPPVEVLLDVDREYRSKSDKESLPTIAPKRFNPEGLAWLPILHTNRGAWHFTALYSNTARAHELGKTRDWVVLYFYDDQHAERQHTIVTQTRGALLGQREVRGREAECAALYGRP